MATSAGIEISARDLADLTERTEGWPAGVYLAALALRGHPAPSTFIRQFTGNSRFVVDFLAEEVLSRQPPGVRQFLARTSILDRFCTSLCDAVVGSADAAEIIDLLERENLFVVPLDDRRQWFRYHHLFAQVLRSELARTEPGIVPALHDRASDWLRRSGLPEEAIRHAEAAGDVAGVVSLITSNWYVYVNAGRVATVRGWLDWLGDDRVAAHPVAAHCAAWTAALSGDRDSVRRWLPVVAAADHDGPLPDFIRSMRSSAALLKGTFGFDGIGPMRDSAAEAITLEPDPASPWHALALAAYATALYWSGDLDAAAARAEQALSATGCVGIIRMLAAATLSLTELDQAKLEQAEQLARAAYDILVEDDYALATAPRVPWLIRRSARSSLNGGCSRRHAGSWSALCASGALSPESARGPRSRSSSAWHRCCLVRATGPQPSRWPRRPGPCSSHCRKAPMLSWPGSIGSTGSLRASRHR